MRITGMLMAEGDRFPCGMSSIPNNATRWKRNAIAAQRRSQLSDTLLPLHLEGLISFRCRERDTFLNRCSPMKWMEIHTVACYFPFGKFIDFEKQDKRCCPCFTVCCYTLWSAYTLSVVISKARTFRGLRALLLQFISAAFNICHTT